MARGRERPAAVKPTGATPDHRRLDPFVGVWRTEGEATTGPSALPVKFRARDTYEWLPGAFFLVHRFDADMPAGNTQGIEIIGYSAASRTYPMHSFDSQGNAEVLHGRIEGGSWTFTGDTIRFTGRFRDQGTTFAGAWERRPRENAPWQHWMDVTLRKAD